MLIILEGSDLVGKTTIAAELGDLAADLGYEVVTVAAGPPINDADPLNEYELGLAELRDDVMDLRHLVIVDRWHLGELVYGPLLRGTSRLCDTQFTHVERWLDAMGAVRVVVDADDDLISARYRLRGDDLLTLEQVLDVAGWYRLAAGRLHWRVLHSPARHQHLLDLLVWAGVEASRAQHLAAFPGYVGPSYPLALLVGDEPNGHVRGTTPNPAFMPYHHNSAHYLLEAMRTEGVSEGYGLCNANDGTDVRALWVALGQPRVLARGRRAEARLRELGVSHTYLPHPQWVRRFRFKDLADYGRLLRHAALWGAA